MPSQLIPLFPLRAVVFPRCVLPLHIFEERYKAMIGEAIRDKREFGVVLAKEEGISNIACTVMVERVLHAYPDGRLDILTRGRRRFQIVTLNEESSCLEAEPSYFDDDDPSPVPSELRDVALLSFGELTPFVSMAGRAAPDLDDPQLSFQLAQFLTDLEMMNSFLAMRSEVARLQRLNQFLSEYIPRQRAIAQVREVAPTNGRSKHSAGF